MKNLTLIIPAKNESESLPTVLTELGDFECKIIIVLDKNDIETINSIKEIEILIHKNLFLLTYIKKKKIQLNEE